MGSHWKIWESSFSDVWLSNVYWVPNPLSVSASPAWREPFYYSFSFCVVFLYMERRSLGQEEKSAYSLVAVNQDTSDRKTFCWQPEHSGKIKLMLFIAVPKNKWYCGMVIRWEEPIRMRNGLFLTAFTETEFYRLSTRRFSVGKTS